MQLRALIFISWVIAGLPGGEVLSRGLSGPALFPFKNDGQRSDTVNHPRGDSRHSLEHIIQAIQDGINATSVGMFSDLFAKQIFMSLQENENGYFSANQAALVLQNYFSSKRNVKFIFSTTNILEGTPYATGGGTFFLRGSIRHFQIYVSLSFVEGRWVITQFNVY